MKHIVTTVLDITNETEAGAGNYIDTIGAREAVGGDARFILDVSTLLGTAPTAIFSILSEVEGIEVTLDSFAQIGLNGGQDQIVIPTCPQRVKAAWTVGGVVIELDAKIVCVRL